MNERVNNRNDDHEVENFDHKQQLRELCTEILDLRKEGSPLSFHHVRSTFDPDEAVERMKQIGLNDLLLQEGDSLSASESYEAYYPNLNLYVGKAALVSTGIRAWGWGVESVEKHHQLDIWLQFVNDKYSAVEYMSISEPRTNKGMPYVSRDVESIEYAESGYEGHNQVGRKACDMHEALGLIALARDIYEARTVKTRS